MILADREKELTSMINLLSCEGVNIFYLYGSRGIGISSLLRRFASSLRVIKDYLVIYVDSIEEGDEKRAYIASCDTDTFLLEIIRSSSLPPGPAPLYNLPITVVRLGLPVIMGRRILIIIDYLDKGIGPGKILATWTP